MADAARSARAANGETRRPIGRLVAFVETVVSISAQIVVAATMLTMFAALFLNAVLRYAFDSGIAGAQELPQFAFPWLVLAGAVLAALRGQQIAVDVLMRVLAGWWRVALALVVNAIVLVLAIAVVDSAMTMAASAHGQQTPVLKIPRSWGYAGLVYGYACIAVAALTNSYHVLRGGPAGYRGAG